MAHASNVSSLVLGKASGRLLATGGDDCRVNLWSINKPNCIMVRFGRWAGWGRWADQGWALGVGSSAETQHISAPPTLVYSGKSRTTQMAGTVASPQEWGAGAVIWLWEGTLGSLYEKAKISLQARI